MQMPGLDNACLLVDAFEAENLRVALEIDDEKASNNDQTAVG